MNLESNTHMTAEIIILQNLFFRRINFQPAPVCTRIISNAVTLSHNSQCSINLNTTRYDLQSTQVFRDQDDGSLWLLWLANQKGCWNIRIHSLCCMGWLHSPDQSTWLVSGPKDQPHHHHCHITTEPSNWVSHHQARRHWNGPSDLEFRMGLVNANPGQEQQHYWECKVVSAPIYKEQKIKHGGMFSHSTMCLPIIPISIIGVLCKWPTLFDISTQGCHAASTVHIRSILPHRSQ